MGKRQPIEHLEFRSKDPQRLRKFYGDAFGWKFKDDMGGYTMIDFGTKDVTGGIFPIPTDKPMITPGISTYVTVKDLTNAEEKLRALGAQIVMSRQEVPGFGHFSTFIDPDGNANAVWQSLTKGQRKKAEKAAKRAAKAAKKAARKAKKHDNN